MQNNFPIIKGTWRDPNPSMSGVGFSVYGGYDYFSGKSGSWRAPTKSDDGWGNLNTVFINLDDVTVENHLKEGWYCSKWEQDTGKILPFGYIHCKLFDEMIRYEGVLLGVKLAEDKISESEVFVTPSKWYFWTTRGMICLTDNEYVFVQPIGYKGVYDNFQIAKDMVLRFRHEDDQTILNILCYLYRNPLLNKLESIIKADIESNQPITDWIKREGYSIIGVDALGAILEKQIIEMYFDCVLDIN
jgi:hypothetical protein